MKKAQKVTLINKRWVFFTLIFAILCALGISTLKEDKILSIIVITIGAFFIFGYAFIFPLCYSFSKEGVTVRYALGGKKHLRWNEIKHIGDCHSGSKGFPWWREYEIGYFETKIPFHKVATIPKSKKVTYLIEKYYPKNIDKYG